MLPTKFRFIWPSGFRGEDLKKSANQKQELPVAAMFLMDRNKMSKLYRGPSIDASYQVSVHLAKGFQRRRLKCEKLMDDRRRTPSDGKSSDCLRQGELKMLKLPINIDKLQLWRLRQHYHQYSSESNRTSCNSSDNVCKDLQIWHYRFYL